MAQLMDQLRKSVENCENLDDVTSTLVRFLTSIAREHSLQGIHFVAGAVSADTVEQVRMNKDKLIEFSKNLNNNDGIFAFSSADVFSDELREKIGASQLKHSDWMEYWRSVLATNLITDIHMTQGWERSTGARDEHEAAKLLGLAIHYSLTE